jgi:hypothetical protein
VDAELFACRLNLFQVRRAENPHPELERMPGDRMLDDVGMAGEVVADGGAMKSVRLE